MFICFVPAKEFLSDIAAFEGILIGIAIPIALQVVTWTAERYKDPEIAWFFIIEERLYRLQYYLFLTNILIAIFLRFLDISNSVILCVIFIWFVINIFFFYKFIRRVEQYVSNPDKIILKRLNEHIEAIFKK